MKVAYLDCGAGASGDMLLAAMIDSGGDRGLILSLPDRLGLDGIIIDIHETSRGGFRGLRVAISGGKKQKGRNLEEIKKIINRGEIPAAVKSRAIKIFSLLARAEAGVHGCDITKIHFHEIGAVDAIIDITGACLLVDDLGIKKLFSSPLPMPMGTVECDHGTIPLPAPALAAVLKGVDVYGVRRNTECVTPTAAAIIKIMAAGFAPMPGMKLETCGHGAGAREKSGGLANILRLFIGEQTNLDQDEVEVIRCNIDDMTPELAAALIDTLFIAGALDATLTPTIMKKGRPGFIVEVISRPEDGPRMREIIFRQSSSIGLRHQRMKRVTLPRVHGSVDTAIGRVKVKKITGPDGDRITPEYEDCRRIAEERGIPLAKIYQEIAGADPESFISERRY